MQRTRVMPSTQPTLFDDLAGLAKRWKLFVVLFITLAVAVNALLGVVLFTLFGFASVTLYGVVVVVRKIVQIAFARASNAKTRRIIRAPLIAELSKAYPHVEREAYRLLRRPLHFHDFKDAVLEVLGQVYDQTMLDSLETEMPNRENGEHRPGDQRLKWVHDQWRELMCRSFGQCGVDTPYVGLVIPTYKTTKLELQRLIESLEDQTYPCIYATIVLNEDSPEMKAFTARLVKKYGGERYIRFVEPRKGKRNAMRAGFADFLDDPNPVKYVFNVDSDSRLEPDAIANAVRLFESDPEIACVTGHIVVSNPDVNLLTKLTHTRFHFAFNVERAAQNLFDAVTCMSGAFMAVRSTFLREILDSWSNQMFLGQVCNYGDDRHIATLALKHGYKSCYCPDSYSWTDVPHQMPVWKKQQTRWARSAWRETIITLPFLHRLPLWIVFEVAYLMLFPFILWGVLFALGLRAMTQGWEILIPYFAVCIVVNFIFNGLYGILTTRDFRFALTPFYLFYQFVYLQPIRLWALASLDKTEWGTK